MADDVALRYHNFSLDDEDNIVMDLGGSSGDVLNDKVSLKLVRRLVMGRSSNVIAFTRTTIHSWGLIQKVIIWIISLNLFVVQFFHWRDKEKV